MPGSIFLFNTYGFRLHLGKCRARLQSSPRGSIFSGAAPDLRITLKAQLSKRSKVEMERDTLEAGAKYNMLIHTSRTAENLKHRAVAYPTKSRAYPKPEGW